MKLKQLAEAVASIEKNHSILIYGPPKSGKTRLVGTAAKIPEIRRILWIDNENGYETLMNMGLTDEELDKIDLIRLPDTRENPVAIETTLKLFSAKTPISICDAHGKVDCVECAKAKASVTKVCLKDYGHNDLVVLDSGSQLGDSALNAACIGQDITYKPQFDDYGQCGKWLGAILSVIQQCQWTNFVVITHELVDEEEINGVKKDKIFPLMGSKTFCRRVSKFFGTVVYAHMKLGKHAAGSSSTYKSDTLTGSRVNATLEKSKDPSMRDILVEGGIIKPQDPEAKAIALASPANTGVSVEVPSSNTLAATGFKVLSEVEVKALPLQDRIKYQAALKAHQAA